MNFQRIRYKAEKAVTQAAKIFNKGAKTVAEKGDAANLVTDADLNIQHFLQEKLHKILPEAGFLCEEENTYDTKSEYIWVIDPIDGTTNFSRDIPECVISVALLHNKKPVIGIIYAPKLNLLFTAAKDGGAFCNKKPIYVSNKDFSHSLFCTALCLYQKEFMGICSDIMNEVYPLCSDTRRFGSCALELCYLAMGRCDLYFEIRVMPWDYAAAYLIVTEAGGILKGFKNEPLTFDKTTVLIGANNSENFEKLNKIITEKIKEPPIFRE